VEDDSPAPGPPPPAPRRVRFGDLRRLTPISRAFGFDRGRPVDRYYLERFLEAHAGEIRGRVLEIGDDAYTRRFGGGRVERSDVLDLKADNPKATFVADLTRADHVPSDSFDCIVCTQTLLFIYDVQAAIATLHRILTPGGVLLGTFPAVSQVCRYDMDRWGDYWRFTTASIARLLGDAFGPEQIEVAAQGNVLAAISFLHGLAAEELTREELDFQDPDYQVIVTARAVKRAGAPSALSRQETTNSEPPRRRERKGEEKEMAGRRAAPRSLPRRPSWRPWRLGGSSRAPDDR
jgi:SAM-dependent methyltransferase